MQPHTDNDPPPSPSPGTSFSASIAQRRLQRRPPPGLRLDMGASAAGTVAGAAGAASPTHLGADSEGPPPTAHGTWTMDGRPTTPALQPAPGAGWDDSAPSTPRLGVPSGRVGLQQSRPIDVIGDFGVGSSDRGSADNVPYDAAGSPTSLQRHTGPLPSSTGVIPAQAAALAGATKDLSLNCGGIGAGEYRGPLARSQPVKQPRSRPLSRVTGLSYISAADMAARLGEAATSGRTGVIIDTRRSADYARARIATATNMSVSTTLAKRKTFTVDRLLEMQRVAGEQWRVVAGWKSAPWVILYGVGPPEETASEDTQLVLLARKFMAEAPEGCGIHVLQCGFDGFVRSHESLCTRGGDVTPSAAACTIPALSLQPASMSTGPLAPRRAARTGVPAVHPRPTIKIDHPMLRTMRQTPGGGFDPSEIVAMRLPHDFSSPPP
ncbi:phosphotyrosine-specific ptp2-like protein, partial [Coemansia spiralis]